MNALRRLVLTLTGNRPISYAAILCGAVLLSLYSLAYLTAVPSSAFGQQIKAGVVTHDAQLPEAPANLTISIPERRALGDRSNRSDSAPTVIDFDHNAAGNPISAPCIFYLTAPLQELYAPLGVHFSGPDPNSGGAILNQCGNFGVSAVSGFNFLAFNRQAGYPHAGVPTDPETITFDSPQTIISMLASAGLVSGTFYLQAFDVNNLVVSTDTQTASQGAYVLLRVSSPLGIRRVVLTRTDNNRSSGDIAFVIDNLSFVQANLSDLCIQDDSSGNLLQINTTTGEYQFTNCGGLIVGGTGTLTRRGSQITLQHNAADRRVIATIDTSTNKATASLQLFAQGRTFSISDRNITNNTCACR
jgi:hypothetical protein